jgi:Flp pilus assembly protein TadD
MKPFAGISCVCLSVVLACAPRMHAQAEKGPMRSAARITVFVRLASGSPAHTGINVRLEADGGGVVDQQLTDSSGKVTFIPRALTSYSVTIHEHGYRDVSRRVDLSFTPTAGISLTITPIATQNDFGHQILDDEGSAIVSAPNLAIPERAMKEFRAGQALLNEKHDVSRSIDHFRKAIEFYDGFAQAYVMLGLAYLQDQKLGDSRSALERAVQLDPKSAVGNLTLGACLNQQRDYAGAENALQRGLELDPESPEGHYEIAKTYWAGHRWQEAEPHALKAETLRPQVPGVHVLMGNILLQKRDIEGAIEEFNEYLRLDPRGPMNTSVRAMVSKLQKPSTAAN